MARNTQPIAKRCKALGISPAVMGYSKKVTERNAKGQMRRKQSEYGLQPVSYTHLDVYKRQSRYRSSTPLHCRATSMRPAAASWG